MAFASIMVVGQAFCQSPFWEWRPQSQLWAVLSCMKSTWEGACWHRKCYRHAAVISENFKCISFKCKTEFQREGVSVGDLSWLCLIKKDFNASFIWEFSRQSNNCNHNRSASSYLWAKKFPFSVYNHWVYGPRMLKLRGTLHVSHQLPSFIDEKTLRRQVSPMTTWPERSRGRLWIILVWG